MSAATWTFLASVVAGLTGIVIAFITTRPQRIAAKLAAEQQRRKDQAEDRSVSAEEVEKLGQRLDSQAARIDNMQTRMDQLEARDRLWRRHYEQDLALHVEHRWPTLDLPEELR